MESLQSQFMASRGHPVSVDGLLVMQMDRVAIKSGVLKIQFEDYNTDVAQGVALKAVNGKIVLPGGRQAKLVYVWALPEGGENVEYQIESPSGELRLWNIYKTPGSVSEADYWTNNAGLVSHILDENLRRYRCSDGIGKFDLHDLVFKVEYSEHNDGLHGR